MNGRDMVRRGLRCLHCQKLFALSEVGLLTKKDFRDLSDPFLAECPHCRQEATYQQDAIGVLVADRFQ